MSPSHRGTAAWAAGYLASLLKRGAPLEEIRASANDAQAAADALGEEGMTLRVILRRFRRDLGLTGGVAAGDQEMYSPEEVAESLDDWARRLRE